MLKADKTILQRFLPSLNYAVSICEGSENADMHNFYLRELRDLLQREHDRLLAEALGVTNPIAPTPTPTSATQESLEQQLAKLWEKAAEQGRLLNTVSFDHAMQSSPAGGHCYALFSVDISACTPVHMKVGA